MRDEVGSILKVEAVAVKINNAWVSPKVICLRIT
jgi:hypothetical protein